MTFNNARRKPAVTGDALPKHVIEQYVHRAQSVRCVCGWTGSSATNGGTASDWSRHVAQFRTVKR